MSHKLGDLILKDCSIFLDLRLLIFNSSESLETVFPLVSTSKVTSFALVEDLKSFRIVVEIFTVASFFVTVGVVIKVPHCGICSWFLTLSLTFI